MSGFSSRVEQMSISGIREVFEAAGEDAINLGLGQPDFPTPEHARKAAIEAINAGKTDGYTSNKGTETRRCQERLTFQQRSSTRLAEITPAQQLYLSPMVSRIMLHKWGIPMASSTL